MKHLKKVTQKGTAVRPSKNKEINFLIDFRNRFNSNSTFLAALKDMRDEGLIENSSYLAMKKKYPVKNNRTKAVKKRNRSVSSSFMSCDSQERLVKHLDKESKKRKEKTPTIGSGCEGPSSRRNC